MARLLSTALIVVLLAGTAAAFAITERLKLQKSPISRTLVLPKVISPDCQCRTSVATVRFNLRQRDRLTVWMEHNGRRASTLVSNKSFPAGPVTLAFDGITEAGLTLPNGVYKPVVHLDRKELTIELPGPSWMRIDTKPPRVSVPHPIYAHISPDGDGRKDTFRVRYRVSEPAKAILLVDGHQEIKKRFRSLQGELIWNGKINGRVAAPGPHVLRISAEDKAGNRAKPFPFAIVTVRFVKLGRDRVIAKPGTHFALLVLSDARRANYLFNRSRGTIRIGANGQATLRLKAPKKPGVYRLFVTANGHAAKALVTVA